MDLAEKEEFRSRLQRALKPFDKNRAYYVFAVSIDESGEKLSVFSTAIDNLGPNPGVLTYGLLISSVATHSKKLSERFTLPKNQFDEPVQPIV